MEQVGGRQAAALDQVDLLEPLQGQTAPGVAGQPHGQLLHRERPGVQDLHDAGLVVAEVNVVAAPVQGHQVHVAGRGVETVQMALQPVAGGKVAGVLRGEPGDRRHPPRADLQLEVFPDDLAVAAQSQGPHVQGLDVGLPAADPGPLFAGAHHPVFDERGVRGGAADVDHHGVVRPGQVAGAGHAGRRPGQNRFDRPPAGRGQAHQRAVALHHHDRRGQVAPFQRYLHLIDQGFQTGDDAGVQHRGLGAQPVVEGLGDLVAADDRQVGRFPDDGLDLQLVRGIGAAGEPGDRKGAHLFLFDHVDDHPAHLLRVDRRGFAAGHLHLAVQDCQGPVGDVLGVPQPVRGHDQEADLLPLALDDGVGGQGGRERDQIDLGQPFRVQLIEGLFDPHGEVPLGGQGLGLLDHRIILEVVDHHIGVGSARVNAQPELDGRGALGPGIFPGFEDQDAAVPGRGSFFPGFPDGRGLEHLAVRVEGSDVVRRDHQHIVGRLLDLQQFEQQVAGAGDLFVLPAEFRGHVPGDVSVFALGAAHAGVDEYGPLVVALPAGEEVPDHGGALAPVLFDQLFEGHFLGAALEFLVRGLARGRRVRLGPLFHPASRDVIGAGVLGELLSVGLVRTEEQGDAVVGARDGQRDVAGADPDGPQAAHPVPEDDQFGGLLSGDLVDLLLEPLAEFARGVVQAAGQKAGRNLEPQLLDGRLDVQRQHSAGDDMYVVALFHGCSWLRNFR